MEKQPVKINFQNIIKFGLFFALALLLIQLLPTQESFSYQYSEDKPWRYDLLISPISFPIYKSEKQVADEREDLLKTCIPYYKIESEKGEKQMKAFMLYCQRELGLVPSFYPVFSKKFNEVYRRGIISIKDYDDLEVRDIERIYIVSSNHFTEKFALKSLYTPKTAYQEIVSSYPESDGQNQQILQKLNLFLVPNVALDSTRSELGQKEILKNLSTTMGFVQAGEKIVDKGENVSPTVFAMLNSLKKETEKQGLHNDLTERTFSLIAKGVLVVAFMILLFCFLFFFRPLMYAHYNNLFLVLLLILLVVSLTSFAVRFQSAMIHYYMVPYAMIPIIIRVFLDSRTAFFTHMVCSVIVSLLVPEPFLFLVMQIAVGMLALFTMKDLVMRSQLAKSAFCVFVCYSVVYLCFSVAAEGGVTKIDFKPLFYFGANAVLVLFSYILIYLFEKLFGFISSVTLVELTNVNSDFMMEFAEVAPGSFQHSLQVSNLAMEAAKKVNANSLLVRTGALYHDIGKMTNPACFTENQQAGSENPLSALEFEEAARIIIDHVTEGVRIAKKLGLPAQIIHFIQTHHGTSKVKYFYNSYINANPGQEPNDAAFTYPGPIPDSKEAAILMMADAVEARSRSLNLYTEESISKMVEDMINMQISDGQLKNAPISFRDVEVVKAVFKLKLANIYHTRISYPKAEVKD